MSFQEIFEGIYRKGNFLYTISKEGNAFFGEKIERMEGKNYREWSPFRSKLAAAILKGLKEPGIKKGSKVLYLGAANGYTASFVSDIVGEKGIVYCVEISPIAMRDLLKVCEKKENMMPILGDARNPMEYTEFIEEKTNSLFEDVASREQVQVMERNAEAFLEKKGIALIAVKARCIDSTKEPKIIYEEVKKALKNNFEIIEEMELEPFEKDHLFLSLRKK